MLFNGPQSINVAFYTRLNSASLKRFWWATSLFSKVEVCRFIAGYLQHQQLLIVSKKEWIKRDKLSGSLHPVPMSKADTLLIQSWKHFAWESAREEGLWHLLHILPLQACKANLGQADEQHSRHQINFVCDTVYLHVLSKTEPTNWIWRINRQE